MLAERVKDWSRAWKQEGLLEGERKGRQEGHQEGHQEGLKEGQKNGEAMMLHRLLELRFGRLADGHLARLREADAETLLRWGERVLTAATLADVFKA